MKFKVTKKRKQILKVLQDHEGVLSAQAIHKMLPEIDLVTIYRNLDLFVKEGLITKMHLDSDEAVYEYQHKPHHHAVCSDCSRVIHFTMPDDKLKQLLKFKDFDIEKVDVVVSGSCKHSHK